MSNKNPKPQNQSAQSPVAAEQALAEQAAAQAEQNAEQEAQAQAKAAEEQEAQQKEEEAKLAAEQEAQALVQQQKQEQEQAPLAGELTQASNNETPAPARPASVGRVVEQAAPVINDELQGKLDRILADVPAAYRADIVRVRMYCQAMKPGLMVSDKVGAIEQAALYRSIQNIINRQGTYFQPLFTALLAVFNAERKGALADTHRNRFMSSVALNKTDRDAMQSLTHLLMVTSDPKGRTIALKQVRLDKALENGLTAEGQRRVLTFFGA